MSGIEVIKNELINQKNIIESFGGSVLVKNQNPTPSEITEGMKTIPAVDFSVTTASEEDVLSGKTFYSGNSEMKIGKANIDVNTIHRIFMFNPKEQTSEDDIYYAFPEGQLGIRQYCFHQNYNKVHIRFNNEIKKMEDYCFYECVNFDFENFESLTSLTHLGMYCFAYGSARGINASQLPNGILSIGNGCFLNGDPLKQDMAYYEFTVE